MALQEAIAADDVNQLYRLIEGDVNLLDQGSEGPFPNTPLHDAADQGKTKVAMEIATLKPLFAQKLNCCGYSPMHLALQNKHYHIVRALMTLDPELIRVRGRGGITPLHFVAKEIGDNDQENVELLELLAEFLYACKSSIKDLTNQCETAVHIAVKMGNTEAFKVLFGWLKRAHLTKILDWKDQDGDTVLHIAASESQPEIIKLLIGYTNVNAKNFHGRTAFEIFQMNPSGGPDVSKRFYYQGSRARYFTPTLSLSQFFSRELTTFERCANLFRIHDESARNIILIVSTVILSATYQAAFTPLERNGPDSSSNPLTNSTVVTANYSSTTLGKPLQGVDPIMIDWFQLYYTICNSTAFFASLAIVGVTISTLHAKVYLSVPVILLGAAYFFNFSDQLLGTGGKITLAAPFVICWLYVMILPCLMIELKIVRRRIDATRRRVATS